MNSSTRMWTIGIVSLVGIVASSLVAIEVGLGHMAIASLYQHGGAWFVPVARDSATLSPSMRLALSGDVPTAGPFAWRLLQPGFEEGEMPVLAGDREVDRLLLARIDPKTFDIIARNDASGTKHVDDWLHELHAALAINGSYYAPSGLPDTPFIAAGRTIGPREYDATQGALVVDTQGASIVDVAKTPWRKAFAGATDALVSYPLLVGPDGAARKIKATRWLANRTFIGKDHDGRMVFGTTKDAFFSLARLATFLHDAPLDLASVLNLDGGPVSCQAISLGSFKRDFCGNYEMRDDDGQLKELMWPYGARWTLPVVVAVVPRP